MKLLPIITIALTLALLGGCQQSLKWTRLDGSSADEARLEQARKACRIDIKLAGVERAEADRDEKIKKSSTNQSKMLAKEEYDSIRRQVYREIDTCMNKQGYKR